MKYLTQEMIDEYLRRLGSDAEIQKKIKGLTISLLLVGTECPGSEDRQLTIVVENGKFTEFSMEAKPAPSDLRTAPFDKTKYTFRAVSSYDALSELVQGKLGLVEAMDMMKIEGDIAKLLAHIEGFTNLLQYMGTLPLEF